MYKRNLYPYVSNFYKHKVASKVCYNLLTLQDHGVPFIQHLLKSTVPSNYTRPTYPTHQARDINDPITPAIRVVGSPNTADITNCTANPAISQHFFTLPLLLWWWVWSVFLRLGILVISNLLVVFLFPCDPKNSCQVSTSISLTHATCKLYFLHFDL